MVVLCNEYTASAGELFTAAIRDYREMGLLNAAIVGVRTYTKGKVQSIFPLSDGSAIVLTIGLFNPPSGVNFDGAGVEPDRTVELTPDPERDNQFDAALEELNKLINK
jgi:carboxyl-terminal processing protease